MNIITLDFETYFDTEYSVKKLSVEAYVRDPRFEVHGVAVRWHDYPDADCKQTLWYDHEVNNYLNQIDWQNCAALCHHAHFDGLILSHHYGIKPAIWLDTLSMGRLLLGNHVSVSLDSIRTLLGMPLKRTPYHLFKGKHWDELDQNTQKEVADGACDEVESIYSIFTRFMNGDYPHG